MCTYNTQYYYNITHLWLYHYAPYFEPSRQCTCWIYHMLNCIRLKESTVCALQSLLLIAQSSPPPSGTQQYPIITHTHTTVISSNSTVYLYVWVIIWNHTYKYVLVTFLRSHLAVDLVSSSLEYLPSLQSFLFCLIFSLLPTPDSAHSVLHLAPAR